MRFMFRRGRGVASHVSWKFIIVKLRVRVRVRVRVKVKVKVKSLKSKLDPEVGSVMGWPTTTTHHPPTRQLFLSLKLLIKAR